MSEFTHRRLRLGLVVALAVFAAILSVVVAKPAEATPFASVPDCDPYIAGAVGAGYAGVSNCGAHESADKIEMCAQRKVRCWSTSDCYTLKNALRSTVNGAATSRTER